MNRRAALSALAIFATLPFAAAPLVTMAHAAEKQQFEQNAFVAAQSAGKPILIDVHAPWCPTCKAQAPILAKLESDPKFKNLVVFEVDFDSRKDVLRKLGVRTQSTLITFRGRQEVGRSVGDTDPGSIAALLNKTI